MKDGGYDISDYCAIAPQFGTLADFQQLLHQAHRRGLKVLIDQVWSHTSHEHLWFQEIYYPPFATAIEIAATLMYAKPSRRVDRLRGLGYNEGSVLRIWYHTSGSLESRERSKLICLICATYCEK